MRKVLRGYKRYKPEFEEKNVRKLQRKNDDDDGDDDVANSQSKDSSNCPLVKLNKVRGPNINQMVIDNSKRLRQSSEDNKIEASDK